jgi:hypothetical protein
MDEVSLENLSFESHRRFGVELEILAFDKLKRPAGGSKCMPKGSEHVVMLVKNNAEENVEARLYEHTKETSSWVVKPDSSCGLEICSPPIKGWRGIRKVCQVVHAFQQDPLIEINDSCSVHVHIEVADLNEKQVATVLAYWVKCEPIFMDLVPSSRKKNRYSQATGMTNLFEHDVNNTPRDLINKIGETKYFSMNCKAYRDGERKTLEVRIIEGAGCKDPYLIKNWLRLILHFVERTSQMPYPKNYVAGDRFSGLLWLDPKDVMSVLGFGVDQYNLSKGLKQCREWMLARMALHTADTSHGARRMAYKELLEIIAELKDTGSPVDLSLAPKDMTDALYNEDLRY